MLFAFRREIRDWPLHLVMFLLLMTSDKVSLPEYANELLVLATAVTAVVWSFTGGKVGEQIVLPTVVFLCWLGLTGILGNAFDVETLAGHLFRVVFAALAASVLADRLFVFFAKWLVLAGAVSLAGYCIGFIVVPYHEAIYSALPQWTKTNTGFFVDGQFVNAWRRSNLGLYTFSPDRYYQNHGFMWEPTAFAMLTAPALMLRVAGGKVRLELGNAILILATLTTVSTTGYIGLGFVLLFMLSRRGVPFLWLMLACIPVLVGLFFGLDFLGPKIQAEFGQGYLASATWALSRFASFQADMSEFAYNPILGAGIFDDARPLYGTRLVSNNGLSDYLVRFGLAWFAFNIFCVGRAVASYIVDRKTVAAILFVLLVLIFAWSEKLLELPIYFTFMLSPLVVPVTSHQRSARPASTVMSAQA